jgi:tetratricopeptide (TPR) repeat protein
MTTRFPALAARVAGQGATSIKALNEEKGIALLRLLAPRVVEAEPERACELVEAVGGLPLALTLMGNYLRAQSASGQPRRIAAALRQLSHASERLDLSELPEPVEHHPGLPGNAPVSLRTIIALTDQHLPEPIRHALHAFSVFPPRPNSFSEEAALAVAVCPVETLDALTDSGLLEINSSGRLTLHQTIADYARQQLCDNTAYRRLIAYTTVFVETHRKDYEQLEVESSSILAALEAASTYAYHTELIRVAVAFAPFLLARGLYATTETHLQRAYDAALARQDHYGLAGVLLYLGEMTWKRGDYDQAEQYLQTGLGYAREIDDHERICAILANLGSIGWKRGDYKLAETYLQKGLTLARDLGNQENMCKVLQILGSVERMQANYSRAEAYLQEGLKLAKDIGEKEITCPIILNLGAIAAEQGNYVRSEAYFQEGLLLARRLHHSEWISAFLNNLGDSASEQGRYDQAMLYFQE